MLQYPEVAYFICNACSHKIPCIECKMKVTTAGRGGIYWEICICECADNSINKLPVALWRSITEPELLQLLIKQITDGDAPKQVISSDRFSNIDVVTDYD